VSQATIVVALSTTRTPPLRFALVSHAAALPCSCALVRPLVGFLARFLFLRTVFLLVRKTVSQVLCSPQRVCMVRFVSSRAHFPVLAAWRNAVPGHPALRLFDLHVISLAMERGGHIVRYCEPLAVFLVAIMRFRLRTGRNHGGKSDWPGSLQGTWHEHLFCISPNPNGRHGRRWQANAHCGCKPLLARLARQPPPSALAFHEGVHRRGLAVRLGEPCTATTG